LDKVIRSLLSNADTPHKNYNQGNAVNAVLFETVNYVIHLDPHSLLIKEAAKILGTFLVGRETNFRYLALETMAHIAATGDPLKTLTLQQGIVITALTDKDISIRRRALDLLYSMCSPTNYQHIVAELLTYLNNNTDYEFQEELVLKIAILAEKFVSEYTWYVDVILKLITTAGDAASDSLWHRVVQIVTNHPDLREYAAYTILQACKGQNCHEVTVRIAGHILGEFGDVVVDSPGCSPLEQFMALHSKFGLFSSTTRAILLSTYLKFVNLFPEIKSEVVKVFEAYQYVLDVELQQRACEYLAILKLPNEKTLQTVCEEMPPFAEKESTLLAQLTTKIHDTQDARTWTIGGIDAQKDIQKVAAMKKSDSEELIPNVEKSPSPARSISPLRQETQRQASPVQSTPTPDQIRKQFTALLTTPNGVLYETSIIQVGLKSEYQNNFGRLAFFFGNKTTNPILDFKAKMVGNDDLVCTVLELCPSTIPASTQLHQMFSIEAIAIPTTSPALEISFTSSGQPILISLQTPIILTKFMSPCVMSSTDYLARYKQIGGAGKESQLTVSPPSGLNPVDTRKVIEGLGFAILDGIDPNPVNLVFASIFMATTTGKVGCLGRIEANAEHGVIFGAYIDV
jgi:AP-2 complex subunit alpha